MTKPTKTSSLLHERTLQENLSCRNMLFRGHENKNAWGQLYRDSSCCVYYNMYIAWSQCFTWKTWFICHEPVLFLGFIPQCSHFFLSGKPDQPLVYKLAVGRLRWCLSETNTVVAGTVFLLFFCRSDKCKHIRYARGLKATKCNNNAGCEKYRNNQALHLNKSCKVVPPSTASWSASSFSQTMVESESQWRTKIKF